jgi:signal peptidase I
LHEVSPFLHLRTNLVNVEGWIVSGVKSELREYIEAFGIAIVLALFIITFIAQSFLVQGASMEPSLHNGQRLLVDKIAYRVRAPQRGEIVVFRYPSDPRRRFIKRVMGLPGDQIEVRRHKLYINGNALEETYINGPTYGDFGPIIVPEDTVFVLGDNRNNSDDSRFSDVGAVPRKLVVGRALFIYWPPTRIAMVKIPQELQTDEG